VSRRPNHLAGQTSPYLLQHLFNPVDWRPWGDDALSLARESDRPLFVSIGYAACHWCHVMERESFEDPAVAALLNERFVPIKVDREERPDLDDVYMNAVQMMTGQGGWPLNVFLTPDLEPFFGGTYFPPEDRWGRIGFPELLRRIDEAWRLRRGDVQRSAAELTRQLRAIADSPAPATDEVSWQAAGARAVEELADRFDVRWGGFGAAPKFPPDQALRWLSASGDPRAAGMIDFTLQRMALGGMYDHVGGGFARYSVDERWLVPHFEKMLYNQALLVPEYAEAYVRTKQPLYRRVVEETLDFVRRELTHEDGALLSSLDADSEGVEGKFYVWTPDQVRAELGREDGEWYCEVYGIADGGNFEGRSIPNLLGGSLAERARGAGVDEDALAARLAPLRARLLEARGRRVRPSTDDKVLTAWNGLMISALARAHQVLGRPEDRDSARRAAEFVLARLTDGDRLRVTWRAGRAQLNGYLDDYAFLARGLLDLYETTFERRYLDRAAALAGTVVARFEDRERGGLWFTSDDHEVLLARSRTAHDGATPAGAAVAIETLLRLAVHLDHEPFRACARNALRAYAPLATRMPSAFAAMLTAAALDGGPWREVAIIGNPADPRFVDLLRAVHGLPRGRIAIAGGPPDGGHAGLPLLDGRTTAEGRPAAYVCSGYACRAPVVDARSLATALTG